jgi:hypothetical protein
MSEGIRPFDWWMLAVEAAVLVLVAYGELVTLVQQITGAKRKKRLRRITSELRGFITSGEEARNRLDSWNARIARARTWIADVEGYLKPRSEKAFEEFRWGSGPVSTELQVRLDNLHRISQNAEHYF